MDVRLTYRAVTQNPAWRGLGLLPIAPGWSAISRYSLSERAELGERGGDFGSQSWPFFDAPPSAQRPWHGERTHAQGPSALCQYDAGELDQEGSADRRQRATLVERMTRDADCAYALPDDHEPRNIATDKHAQSVR